MELSLTFKKDYMIVLNKLFSKVIIPTPILDDENIYDDLGNLEFEEGIFETNLGYNIFVELGNSNNNLAKRLSEYDRYIIAIAGEKDILAVSNDNPIRKICKKYDIKITGILGVICSAYENNIISFEEMSRSLKFLFSPKSSCYLSTKLKNKIFNYYSVEI